ncbi:MAG: FxLYD domain-containing protein [Ignavibacteria bacterium]|nr:FxLYD domain-containing protein [Ignavibacteria bacterium]
MSKIFPAIIAGLFFTGCFKGEEPIVILSAVLTDRKEVTTAVPEEYSSFAPAAAGATIWVVGEVKNRGDEDVANVEIIFKCTDGVDNKVLVATVPAIPAGKAVAYRTKGYRSRYNVKLSDEAPKIEY